MEGKIKNIISAFIRVPTEQISHDTIIDRSSVSSSITLHRMYAKLAEEGIVVEDYWNIKKFSTLLERINGNGHNASSAGLEMAVSSNVLPSNNHIGGTVGIDIEDIDAMPRTNDFREEEFYKLNFSSTEIAYCILQPSPYASFTGLFAAKEAIVKANNSYRNKPFNTIVINHDPEGKPEYPGFYLSVSHTNNMAVAVALQTGTDLSVKKATDGIESKQSNRPNNTKWLFVISFLISLAAFIIALLK